jgi:hypothetical protein
LGGDILALIEPLEVIMRAFDQKSLRKRTALSCGLLCLLILCSLPACISLDKAFVHASRELDETLVRDCIEATIKLGEYPVRDEETGEILFWRALEDDEPARMRAQAQSWREAIHK